MTERDEESLPFDQVRLKDGRVIPKSRRALSLGKTTLEDSREILVSRANLCGYTVNEDGSHQRLTPKPSKKERRMRKAVKRAVRAEAERQR